MRCKDKAYKTVCRKRCEGAEMLAAFERFKRDLQPGDVLRVGMGYDDDLYYSRGLTGCSPRRTTFKAVIVKLYPYTATIRINGRLISADYIKLYLSHTSKYKHGEGDGS